MIDIEKEIRVSGPCKCGQIAVVCTLKMLLEKQTFFCEACGTEFSGDDFPSLFDDSVSSAKNSVESQLFSDVKELFSFIYGSSDQISSDLIKRLLSKHPEYRSLFPLSLLPGEMIVAELESRKDSDPEILKEIVSSYPWQKFTTTNWLDLFGVLPDMANKCDKWKDFTPEQWMKLKSHNYSLYRKYFTKKNLGLEMFMRCVTKEPQLLEKTIDDAKWEVADAADTIVDAAKGFWRKLW